MENDKEYDTTSTGMRQRGDKKNLKKLYKKSKKEGREKELEN